MAPEEPPDITADRATPYQPNPGDGVRAQTLLTSSSIAEDAATAVSGSLSRSGDPAQCRPQSLKSRRFPSVVSDQRRQFHDAQLGRSGHRPPTKGPHAEPSLSALTAPAWRSFPGTLDARI
jgi:hypothetical protein